MLQPLPSVKDFSDSLILSTRSLKRARNNFKMSPKYAWWNDIIEDALSYFEPEIVEYTSIVYSIHVWYDRQA